MHDIPLLVSHFIKKYSARTGKKIERVSHHVLELLQTYHWLGNVTELENIIERAVIVSPGKQLKLVDWLPQRGIEDGKSPAIPTLEDRERQHICEALELTDRRVNGEKGAARMLNINPKNVRAKMRKLGIKRNS